MKIVGYYRVSSREQKEEGYSIEAQQKQVIQYAEKKGFELVKDFVEIETAKKAGRKVFNEMLEFIKLNDEIEGIVSHKVDRLCRNFRDYITVDDLINNKGFKVKPLFVEEEFPETATGKLTFGLKVLLAKHYIDNLSDEVKKGMKEKVEQGGYPHKPPFGYKIDSSVTPHLIIPHPTESITVQRAFEYYSTHAFSIKQLAKKLNEEGIDLKANGRPLAKSDIGHILRNPFYYGWFEWKGNRWDSKGTYQPIITRHLWEQVQFVLDDQNKPRTRKNNFNYTMLMKCGGCGYSITAEKKTKYYKETDRSVTYIYYHCSGPKNVICNEKPISEKDLVSQLTEIIRSIKINDSEALLIKTILKESHSDEEEFHTNALKNLNERYKAIQEKKDRMLDAYLEGILKKDYYEFKAIEIQREQTQVEEQIAQHKDGNEKYFGQIERIVDICNQAATLFEGSDVRQKRELLRYVVSDLKLKGKTVYPSYQIPFSMMIDSKKTQNWSG